MNDVNQVSNPNRLRSDVEGFIIGQPDRGRTERAAPRGVADSSLTLMREAMDLYYLLRPDRHDSTVHLEAHTLDRVRGLLVKVPLLVHEAENARRAA